MSLSAPTCSCGADFAGQGFARLRPCPIHGNAEEARRFAARLKGDVFLAVQEQVRLRHELAKAAARMHEAADLITPGMKAGTADAKAILLAARADITTALGGTDGR